MIGVYKITNTINGKCYIGKSSRDIEYRLEQHKNNHNSRPHLQNAIKKYGINNFIFEIIEVCNTEEDCIIRERYWIEYYDSMNNGYNYTTGGEGKSGFKLSEESRRKISESSKNLIGEKNPFYGKTHTEETKRKIGEKSLGKIPWNKGKPWSEEVRKKIKDHSAHLSGKDHPMYGKRGKDAPNYGKHMSEENREKLRIANTGKELSKETRQKISNSIKGRKHMNNGIIDKLLKPEDFDKYLDEGFVFGCLTNKKIIN